MTDLKLYGKGTLKNTIQIKFLNAIGYLYSGGASKVKIVILPSNPNTLAGSRYSLLYNPDHGPEEEPIYIETITQNDEAYPFGAKENGFYVPAGDSSFMQLFQLGSVFLHPDALGQARFVKSDGDTIAGMGATSESGGMFAVILAVHFFNNEKTGIEQTQYFNVGVQYKRSSSPYNGGLLFSQFDYDANMGASLTVGGRYSPGKVYFKQYPDFSLDSFPDPVSAYNTPALVDQLTRFGYVVETIDTSNADFVIQKIANIEDIFIHVEFTNIPDTERKPATPTPPHPPDPGPVDPDNPYNPGGTTKPDDPETPKGEWAEGDGPFVPEQSPLWTTFPGLFRVYGMTIAQAYLLGQKLWNGTILDDIAKYFDNPMDVILSFTEFPFDVGGKDAVEIKFNWLPSWLDGPINVTGHPIENNFRVIDFGEINIPRYSGSFYDFQPYTQAQVYIPYVGYVPVKFSEIVGATIGLKYVIDIITGVGIAYLTGKPGMIGAYKCVVGRNMPLTSRNFSELYFALAKTALLAVATAGAGVAAGAAGASAGAATGATAGQLAAGTGAAASAGVVPQSTAMTVSEAGAVGQYAGSTYGGPPIDFSQAPPHGGITPTFEGQFAQSALNGAMNANYPIQRSGDLDAISGRCAAQNAAIFISIPHQNMPENYQGLLGFPSNIGGICSDFTGYTKFRKVFLQVETYATQQELDEAEQLMMGGVVI